MNELNELDSNLQLITKTICLLQGADEEITQSYLDVAERCTEHFKAFSADPKHSHVAEILKESKHSDTMADLTNLLNLVLSGHVLVTKAQAISSIQYHKWVFDLTLLFLSIFYQFGYADGSKTATPDAFDDFVSSLDIDDK